MGMVVHSPGGGQRIRGLRFSSVILDAGESNGEPIPGEGVLCHTHGKRPEGQTCPSEGLNHGKYPGEG